MIPYNVHESRRIGSSDRPRSKDNSLSHLNDHLFTPLASVHKSHVYVDRYTRMAAYSRQCVPARPIDNGCRD